MLKEGEIKVGDTVLVDGGFTCITAGPVIIQEQDGELYFRCSEGNHYIDGQLEEDGTYIGIEKV